MSGGVVQNVSKTNVFETDDLYSASLLPYAISLYLSFMDQDQPPWRGRIVGDQRILAGKPVVRGTRIAVETVLEELSDNPDIGVLLAHHPELTIDDVQACFSYARTIVTGQRIYPLVTRPRPIKTMLRVLRQFRSIW